jgi:hypothetical protein
MFPTNENTRQEYWYVNSLATGTKVHELVTLWNITEIQILEVF